LTLYGAGMISKMRISAFLRLLFALIAVTSISCGTASGAQAATDNQLSITHYQQQTKNGCGPTAIQVVVKYKQGILNSQCTYWKVALSLPSSSPCPDGSKDSNKLQISEVRSGLQPYLAYPGTISSPGLTWSPLKSNIAAKSPIIALVGLLPHGGAGSSSAVYHYMTVYGYHESNSGKRSVWVSNRDAEEKSGSLGTNAKHVKIEIHAFRGERYNQVDSDTVDTTNLVGIHN